MLIQKLKIFSTQTPDKQAIVFQGKGITYAQLWQEIEQRCHSITEIPNHNLILANSNEIENLLNFLAGMAMGKVGIFAGKHLNDSQLNKLKKIHEAFIFDENLEHKNSSPIYQRKIAAHSSLNTIFLGVLTSGTTSIPKLIFKDYQAWFSAFPHQSTVFGINKTDRLFVLDALSYSANLNAVLHMLWLGASVILTNLKTANSWVQQIAKEQVSTIFMVPSHFRLLLNNADISLNGTVKSLVSAGEKLDPKTAQNLLNFAPKCTLTEYYGSAELGHITYHQNQDIIQNPLSVGLPFPEVKITIENEQIFVESPYISPDYRHTKSNFDLGYFIDNQLVLMGRAGRMFNRRGLNVFAEEIENEVKKLPFIIEVAAVGLLYEDQSHEIFLAYTCIGGYQNNSNNTQIIRHLSANLQATKIPQIAQEFENLPRTDFGKIDFNALARSFEEDILV